MQPFMKSILETKMLYLLSSMVMEVPFYIYFRRLG